MGLFASQFVHAGYCNGAGRRHDRKPTQTRIRKSRIGWFSSCLICLAGFAQADSLRIASFHTELSRKGPGLLLRDILKETDDVVAVAKVITQIKPDIIALQDFDFDADLRALEAFSELLEQHGHTMPYYFALMPNTGMRTGLDMDGNGKIGEARDAQGYGRFSGDGGMALLARMPILADQVTDFSQLLWRDVPDANLPKVDGSLFPNAEVYDVQRLSTTAHWLVPVQIDENTVFTALMFHATPPVFDGPEDRNGKRNSDEVRLWSLMFDGKMGPKPKPPFAIMGTSNLDPVDGEGLHHTMTELLTSKHVIDARPSSLGGHLAADANHKGIPSLDTVDFKGPGNLRADYVLPSSNVEVTDAGVFWPAPTDATADLLGADGLAAGRHRLVWMDILW